MNISEGHPPARKSHDMRIAESKYGKPIEVVLFELHQLRKLSTPQMAEELGVKSPSTPRLWMNKCDTPRRSQSEATTISSQNPVVRKHLAQASRASRDKRVPGIKAGVAKYWQAQSLDTKRDRIKKAKEAQTQMMRDKIRELMRLKKPWQDRVPASVLPCLPAGRLLL